MRCHRFQPTLSRRAMLRASAGGFGHLALSGLLGQNSLGATTAVPHIVPRAKRIIFLFMWGGPSHVDLFDPKPSLNTFEGKPLAGKDVGVTAEVVKSVLERARASIAEPILAETYKHVGLLRSR